MRVTTGGGRNGASGSGASARLTPPSASRPIQKVIEQLTTICAISSAVTPQRE